MAQGFVKSKNLRESSSPELDTNAFNNLTSVPGQENVVNDIKLFSNNRKDVSVLQAGSDFIYDYPKRSYLITNPQKIAFSNKTIIYTEEQNSKELEVFDSNGIDKFKLKLKSNGEEYVNENINLIRKDITTLENIKNLNKERSQTINISPDELDSLPNVFELTRGDDIFNSSTIPEFIDLIQFTIDKFLFKKDKSFVLNENKEIDQTLTIDGNLSIINEGNISFENENSPGIFISSGQSKVRAFSSTFNPWSTDDISNKTLTSASKIFVKTLIASNLNFSTLTTNNVTSSDVKQDYTHKVKVTINEIEYFLLCKST